MHFRQRAMLERCMSQSGLTFIGNTYIAESGADIIAIRKERFGQDDIPFDSVQNLEGL